MPYAGGMVRAARDRPGGLGAAYPVARLAAALLLAVAAVAGCAPVADRHQSATFEPLPWGSEPRPAAAERPPALAWRYRPEGEVLASELTKDRLYLAEQLGSATVLVSVDLLSGLEAWRVALPSGRVNVTAFADQLLVSTTTSGGTRLAALDPSQAIERWSVNLAVGEAVATSRSGVLVRPRAAADGSMLMGRVRLLDSDSGRELWARPDSAAVDLGVGLVAVTNGQTLALVELATGRERASYPFTEGARPLIQGDAEVGLVGRGSVSYRGADGASVRYVQVAGLDPSTIRRLSADVSLGVADRRVVSVDRRNLGVVDLAPAAATDVEVVGGRGERLRLLFTYADRLVAVDVNGTNRLERPFPAGTKTQMAGAAGWLAYACDGAQVVTAYDVRTLLRAWTVTVASPMAGGCAALPVDDGFLVVGEDLEVLGYRSP